MTGGETLKAAQEKINKEPAYKSKWPNRKVPILIYTGYHIKDVLFPEVKNFWSVGVWDKLTPYKKLLPKTAEVLSMIHKDSGKLKAS